MGPFRRDPRRLPWGAPVSRGPRLRLHRVRWTLIEADGRCRAIDVRRRALAAAVERTMPLWTVLVALAAAVFACGFLAA